MAIKQTDIIELVSSLRAYKQYFSCLQDDPLLTSFVENRNLILDKQTNKLRFTDTLDTYSQVVHVDSNIFKKYLGNHHSQASFLIQAISHQTKKQHLHIKK